MASANVLKRLSEALIESTTWYDGKPHLTPEEENLLKEAEEIIKLQEMMEEMAGGKESYGNRSPGEKCKYEIQRRESAIGITPHEDAGDSKINGRIGNVFEDCVEETSLQETNKRTD